MPHPRFNQTLTALLSRPQLLWGVVGWGILVRLVQYLFNRSLWADEVTLALNIIHRSYAQLWQPLDYQQGAPIGFLMVEKAITQLWGTHEYALRLWPLLSGLLALILLARLAQKLLAPSATVIAVGLFAMLPSLIFYASELKQYSSDVMITLLLMVLLWPEELSIKSTPRARSQSLESAKLLLEAGIGAMAIWFSHPAIFVLAGMASSRLVIDWVKKRRIDWARLGVYLVWLVSFAMFYQVSLSALTSNQALLSSWSGGFPATPLHLPIIVILAFLSIYAGSWFFLPNLIASIIGGIALFRQDLRGLWICSPIIMALVAASLHKFPFRGRLVLFAIPIFILLVAAGLDYLLRKTGWQQTLGMLLVLVIFLEPMVISGLNLVRPQQMGEIKPVLSYMQTHWQATDLIYVFQRGVYQFQYYAPRYDFPPGRYILGVDDLDTQDGYSLSSAEKQRYTQDLQQLKGRDRVWFLCAHCHVKEENDWLAQYLSQHAQKLDQFDATNAFVALYKFAD
jgi:hypothetical protein